VLTERVYPVDRSDLNVISNTTETDWSDVEDLENRFDTTAARLRGLADNGLLVCDCDDPAHARLKERNDCLRRVPWNRFSQYSHFMTKWSDDFLSKSKQEWDERNMPASFLDFEERFGPAPPACLEYPDAGQRIRLPLVKRREALFGILEKRRTTRTYHPDKRLPLADLATVLYYCFGCQGVRKMSRTLTLLKKTSPSGGALHPIEVYPLVCRVEGLTAGAYHYDVSRHSLDPLSQDSAAGARNAALRLVADQQGIGGAHVIFALVARFDRYFWKYQNHSKAYKVISMDAAHLTQTLFLVSAQLGLGAFVTGAINDRFAEELFEIDDANHGVMAVCGCGVPAREDHNGLDPVPFVPGDSGLKG